LVVVEVGDGAAAVDLLDARFGPTIHVAFRNMEVDGLSQHRAYFD
jgi:hypothetical protein